MYRKSYLAFIYLSIKQTKILRGIYITVLKYCYRNMVNISFSVDLHFLYFSYICRVWVGGSFVFKVFTCHA